MKTYVKAEAFSKELTPELRALVVRICSTGANRFLKIRQIAFHSGLSTRQACVAYLAWNLYLI